ncbi:MAG: ABC transporter substrate-binding protein [Desulfotalea sp.]|nr:MAG: ABC transporter substrate-binding protein [Desulfotalea sp.]
MNLLKKLLQLFCVLCFFVFVGGLKANVSLPSPSTLPQRIVSLGPINTENVFLLGAGDRIVGSTVYCVRPAAARKTVKVGSVMHFSLEKLISLQPDLILATGFTQPQQLQKLQSLGLPVVQFGQPHSFSESCAQLVELGRLLGLEAHAKEIVEGLERKVTRIKEKVAPLVKPKVFLQIGSSPLHGVTGNTFSDDYISFSGAINITREQQSGKTNREKVLTENPEVIIIAIMGSEAGVAAKEKVDWQHFTSIQAVQDNRVYVINPDIACSPSPATFVEALQIICSFIHPGIIFEEVR